MYVCLFECRSPRLTQECFCVPVPVCRLKTLSSNSRVVVRGGGCWIIAQLKHTQYHWWLVYPAITQPVSLFCSSPKQQCYHGANTFHKYPVCLHPHSLSITTTAKLFSVYLSMIHASDSQHQLSLIIKEHM